MRRRRKGPDALLTAKLDQAWAKRVKELAGWCCERCGRSDRPLDAHHHIRKWNFRTRWVLENGISLCKWTCHKQWAHGNDPSLAVDWFREHRPLHAEYVDSIKNEVSHYTVADKKAMLADLLVPSAESEGMADDKAA